MLSPLLHNLAEAQAPRLLLSLRPQDPLPVWVTHCVTLGPELRIAYQGPKEKAPNVPGLAPRPQPSYMDGHLSREGLPLKGSIHHCVGEPIVEMQDVVVNYGPKIVLGNWSQTIDGEARRGLQWTVRRGERWGVFGPNGKLPPFLSLSQLPRP